MGIKWTRDKGIFLLGCCNMYQIFSRVHPVGDEFRVLHDKEKVVRSITKERTTGVPVDPRPFPKGKWEITGIDKWDAANAKYYGEWNIRTNAHQQLQCWALDANGGYDKPLDKYTDDWGYSIHYSVYNTSLGCGVSSSKAAIDDIALNVMKAIKNGEKITLEVSLPR